MKNVYRLSFFDGDAPQSAHVLASDAVEAIKFIGSPSDVQVSTVCSDVEVPGADKPHPQVKPKAPTILVPQNIPLQQSEIEQLRAQLAAYQSRSK